MNNWYYLDPDNNKKDPENGLFCVRCKRKLKDTQAITSFISVELHPEHPWVKNSPLKGKYLIGLDCWDKIKNNKVKTETEIQNTRLRELIVVKDFEDRDKYSYKKGEVYWQIQTPISGNRNWNFLYIEGKDGNPLMVKVKNIDYANK